MTSYSGRPDQGPEPEGRPTVQVACCLCRRVVPPAQEVFALDAEWQRRFPSMAGVLACEECVLDIEWTCLDQDGKYVPGHIPATGHGSGAQDVDSWSHLPAQGSLVSRVQQDPDSATGQGAEDEPRRAAAPESRTVDLAEQRTDLLGLIDAWQTTRPSRAKRAGPMPSPGSPRH